MPEQKVDGVIDAVCYKNGQIAWVRLYERRGPTYSDVVLLQRAGLIERMTRGKSFVTGHRTAGLASTFTVAKSLRLVLVDGRQFVTTAATAARDDLEDTPVI
jgi:hypothetical protein